MATSLTVKSLTVITLMLAGPTLLAGCGRDGAPLKPSQAAIERAKEAKQDQPAAPTPNSQNEDKRFILDGLLE